MHMQVYIMLNIKEGEKDKYKLARAREKKK